MITKEENEEALRKVILAREAIFLDAGIVTRDSDGKLRDLYDIINDSFEQNKRYIAENIPISREFLEFFGKYRNIIGDYMSREYSKTCFNVKYCVGDQVIATASIPYAAMRDSALYSVVWDAQQEHHKYHLVDSFFNPNLRRCIMEGREGYEDWINSYFDSINEEAGKIMLTVIRDQFPDFYKFITEKYEIPKVEEVDEWLRNKKEIRQLLNEVEE